jgi:transposase
LRHTGLTAFPAVKGKRIPTILQVGFMPAADGIVVQVEKLYDPSTAFPVVEQQDRICPAGNTVVLALATHAKLRLPEEELKDKPKRRPIPDHIPRMEVELTTGDDDCAQCGGGLRRLGEDVTAELEYVPGRFIVNRIVRPRFACSGCEAFTQAALPSRPIERGRPGPGLLAHVLVNKYADHLPLYRQSGIFERDGLDIDRSTLFF